MPIRARGAGHRRPDVGASGKIPAAIHLTPEAASGGPITRIRDEDLIRLDAVAGTLEVELSDYELMDRAPTGHAPSDLDWVGTGRELFSVFRHAAGSSDAGAAVFGLPAARNGAASHAAPQAAPVVAPAPAH